MFECLTAKEVLELIGESQSTFSDMVSELGLAAALGPKAEYTLLVPLNSAFTSKSTSAFKVRNDIKGLWWDLFKFFWGLVALVY